MINIGSKLGFKLRQSAAFIRHARTPLPLILDSFRLKHQPFIAESRDGLKLELLPRDGESFTFYENLIRRDYLQHGIQLGRGDTVVDVGANIGSFAVLAAHTIGPEGKVLALEPASVAFARLERNIKLNGFTNVTPIKAAVGGTSGKARLYLADRSAYATLHEQVDGRKLDSAETVQVETLASLMEEFALDHIKLLKLDCEGAEYDILGHLEHKTADKIEQIAIEVHQIPGRDRAEIPRMLQRLGFTTLPTYPLVAFRSTGVVGAVIS